MSVLVGLLWGASYLADAEQACAAAQVRTDVERILSLTDLGDVYVEDAAADGTISAETSYRSPRKALVPILRCSKTAPPVLIDCLTDTRLTAARFRGGAFWKEPIRVPLGYVCLDLLLVMSTFQSGNRDPETENDDGLGAGVKASFYFRPDDYEILDRTYRAKPVVLAVQKEWKLALHNGQLSFKYPVSLPGQE